MFKVADKRGVRARVRTVARHSRTSKEARRKVFLSIGTPQQNDIATQKITHASTTYRFAKTKSMENGYAIYIFFYKVRNKRKCLVV